MQGTVFFIGAGPGDPDLLTIRAARLIGQAEVVFVDRLVGVGVMDLVSPTAEIVPVGKSKGEHSVPQEEIHRRMQATGEGGAREGIRLAIELVSQLKFLAAGIYLMPAFNHFDYAAEIIDATK